MASLFAESGLRTQIEVSAPCTSLRPADVLVCGLEEANRFGGDPRSIHPFRGRDYQQGGEAQVTTVQPTASAVALEFPPLRG